jgi:hypothetical protein
MRAYRYGSNESNDDGLWEWGCLISVPLAERYLVSIFSLPLNWHVAGRVDLPSFVSLPESESVHRVDRFDRSL